MSALAALVDVLCPPRCAACRELLELAAADTSLGALCPACASTLEPIGEACERCGLPGPSPCAECLDDPPPFEGARAAFLYGAAIAELLHRFKYEDHPELARPLGRLLAELELPTPDVVTPVPLHASRRRARTYDQALYLAQALCRARGWTCAPGLLVRQRATARQVGQSRDERTQNVAGAFALAQPVTGKRVLLVDDVVTTGATAAECARALLAGGAASVWIASVARAV